MSTGPDVEQLAEKLDEYLFRDIDSLEETTEAIDSTFNSAVLSLYARCAVDPRAAAAETWESMVNAMQLGSALFATTGITEGTVECRINRKLRTLPAARGPRSSINAGNWLSAFWLAVICHEQQRMTQLCEISLERLRAPEGAYDEYIYHWVDTLQTYWLRRPGLAGKLTTAIEMTDPAIARIAPLDLLQGQLYPPMNLFYHFVTRDTEGFTPALTEALKLHQAYWTLTEERTTDIDGSIALGPLAIACLAHDGKFPIGIESDYLPKHLLQHTWLGEFPT
ncbi:MULTISPECIES: immunity 49 family protein [unclassified Streptomyces]|uniref:immunity 49 family protein n=1 Tax=unclassified Streptomyces TaxID=2593676 RepID=UPI0035DAA599